VNALVHANAYVASSTALVAEVAAVGAEAVAFVLFVPALLVHACLAFQLDGKHTRKQEVEEAALSYRGRRRPLGVEVCGACVPSLHLVGSRLWNAKEEEEQEDQQEDH
jgi:hypothetical protein